MINALTPRFPSDKYNHITAETFFQDVFTKDEPPTSGERGTTMRRILIYLIYSVTARLDDIAFYVLSGAKEDIGMTIETHWSEHLY